MRIEFFQDIIDVIRKKKKFKDLVTIFDYIKYGYSRKIYSEELKLAINKYNSNKNANILIENDKNSNNKCAIYFSSNGMYGGSMHLNNFIAKIIKNNSFEFYKTRYSLASQHIFLRDVKYLWYQYGINNVYNSIEKVASLLKNLTDNKEIVTFGGSAGGYAAILFGILIGAKYVIVSDPQIDFQLMLKNQYDKNEYAEHYENSIFKKLMSINLKYANLQSLIKNSKAKIYVISSQKSWIDLPQYDLLKGCENVHFLLNNSNEHVVFGSKIFSDIINLNEQELDLLFSNKLYTSTNEVKNVIELNKQKLAKISSVVERERERERERESNLPK